MGSDLDANVKRLGLAAFRIAMILSGLRMLEEGISSSIVCSDTDFSTALTIAMLLEKHANAVYGSLPKNGMKGVKLKFFEMLPEKFNRQVF